MSPVAAEAVPPLADCFIPRAETGPGSLDDACPSGRRLVLTAPPVPPQPVHDWPGGTGKTQLAAYLARTWRQENRDGVLLWLTAASRDWVLSGYAQAAAGRAGTVPADDAEATAARFLSWLAEAPKPWLAVLDGVSDPADLDGLWPEGPAGRVLVTAAGDTAVPGSRNPLVLPVGAFSPHEALSYLIARLSADPDQRLGAADLVHDLDCDPLALAQAGAAIASSGISCRDYREEFAKRRVQIAEAAGIPPAAKAVTWTLSVECADEIVPGGVAQQCLALAVLLGCQGIPETVFSAPAVAEFIAFSAGVAADPGRARSALLGLQHTGLLTIDPSGTAPMVRVHPAVHAAVTSAMPDSMRDQAARAAADALLQVWPDEAERSPLACALRACAASLQRDAADALWAGGSHHVLFRAGQSLDAARLTRPAVGHWRKVAGTSERVLGPAHSDTLLASIRLASAALAAGLSADAVLLYQGAMDAQARLLGSDHPQAIAARADFGGALLTAGQPGEAITVLEVALTAAERHRGSSAVDILAIQDSLAAAYQGAGQHQDAIRLAGRTLTERDRSQGTDHPETLNTRRSLARACLAAGRTKDAIAHGRRALEGAERTLGASHPDTIDAVSVLASAYHSARRLKDAIPLYERAVSDRERAFGPDDPDTIVARGNLASAYHSAGRLATAMELYERTGADCRRVLGPDHPDTLAARANLAHAYYAMGRLTEASKLLESTLADCERVLTPGDPLTAAVRESLDAVSRG